ncbi:hypothetical protein [Streptomyces sp. V4I2]|uniref:hypothetical protein n=1 Tax=Streptomyces sp. V4I2 TaxID=3042280 RepID=UPI00277F5929|nr:hypothetical protein [Streptomyces sp. V4I2]MDQ1046463.1 hypothetical protein [Streptomyces sp. V4I2]
MGIGATASVAAVGGIALTAQAASDPTDSTTSTSSGSGSGSPIFDKDAYTQLTKTITDADGNDKAVVYHFWKAVTYVAIPVDEAYQSVSETLCVPVVSGLSGAAWPCAVTVGSEPRGERAPLGSRS